MASMNATVTVRIKLIGVAPNLSRLRLVMPLLKLAKAISGIEFELRVQIGDTWHFLTI